MFDRPSVLIVDDDSEIVRGASLRLRAAGYHTLTAQDGQTAVVSAAASRPNAIVLDVRMPVQNGLVALAELKQRPDTRDIPVIMLSASIGDQQAALDAGAQFFLRKPYRGEDLVRAVNTIISQDSNDTREQSDGISQPADRIPLTSTQDATGLEATSASGDMQNRDCRISEPALPLQGADENLTEKLTKQELAQQLSRPRLLCIDDDPHYATLLKPRLELLGIDVVWASDVEAGLQAGNFEKAIAILIDYQLPIGRADDILRQLDVNPTTKDIPVIVIGGRNDRALPQKLSGLGVACFLTKPLNFEELVWELNSHIVSPLTSHKMASSTLGTRGDRKAHPASPTRASSNPSKVPTVLCIDDDPDVSCAVEIYMRRYYVKVVRAFHGMHGLAEAIRTRPDVIVMDLSMPNGDGKAILEILRRNRTTEATPVIIMSGINDRGLIRKVTALGANRFIHKPARLEELMREISRFVDLRVRCDEAEELRKHPCLS
jgi:DNA-binding response OmpR family regulator